MYCLMATVCVCVCVCGGGYVCVCVCVCVCVLDETGREGGVKQLVISIWPNLQLENSRGHECSSIGKLFSLSWHSASMVNLQGHKKLHLDPPTLQFLQ